MIRTNRTPETLLSLLLAFLLTACGVDFIAGNGNGLKPPTFPPETTYSGLGSFWDYEKNGKQFRITRRESATEPVDGIAWGTWEMQKSGFVRLSFVAGAQRFSSVKEGQIAWGLEIPGVLLVLSIPEENKLLYMPVRTSCPASTVTANVISMAPGAVLWDTDRVLHGRVTMDYGTGTGTISEYPFAPPTTQPASATASFHFSCANGILALPQGEKIQDGVLTASGVGSINHNGGVLLVPNDDLLTADQISGDFSGLAFANGGIITAIDIRLAGGVGTAREWEAVEGAGRTATGSAPVSVADWAPGGLLGSFLYSLRGDTRITDQGLGVLLATRNIGGSDKIFLAGAGQEPNSSGTYFMFAVQRD